jgi:hemerythrin-like metal-binding protein
VPTRILKGVAETMMSTVTNAVTWSSQYSVGIATIDSEHQKLIGLINDLHAAMREGRGKAAMGRILDGVAAYTVSHFANEEKLMRLHLYPGYERHKAEHDKLVKQVKSLQAEFHSGNATISLEVMAFLQDWLVNHIVGVDKRYTAHFQAAGVR